jgi:hypothetical protein
MVNKTKSLIEELPKIIDRGKKEANRILESLSKKMIGKIQNRQD